MDWVASLPDLDRGPDWMLFRDGCPGGETPEQAAVCLCRAELGVLQHLFEALLVLTVGLKEMENSKFLRARVLRHKKQIWKADAINDDRQPAAFPRFCRGVWSVQIAVRKFQPRRREKSDGISGRWPI